MSDQSDPFALIITRSFYNDLQKIDRPDQIRIRKVLDDIVREPYKGRKVASAEIGHYRWRVGNYRIRYDVSEKQVVILRVMKREGVYRKF